MPITQTMQDFQICKSKPTESVTASAQGKAYSPLRHQTITKLY